MKILHTADWHIGNFRGPEKNGVNLRGERTLKCIEQMVSIAKRERPELIIVAGDLFHDAKVWAARGLTEVMQATQVLRALSNVAPVIVLRGTPNHDGLEQFESLQTHLTDNDKIHISTRPEVITVALETGACLSVACVPGFDRGEYRAKNPGISKEEENLVFTQSLGEVILGLNAQCQDETSVLVSHYTVSGANLESGQTQFFSQFEPIIEPHILDASNFNLVALGHIHRPQQVSSCKNTFYSGSINANNFNDEGQERGFWIHSLDSQGNDVQSVFYETPYTHFHTLALDNEMVRRINQGETKEVLSERIPFDDGIVRVRYSCFEENGKALNKGLLEKSILDAGAFWVAEIVAEQIEINANRDVIEKTDPFANVAQWLQEKALGGEKIKEVLEIATPIIQQSLASHNNARRSGIFEPVEIAVKNYRNYVEETFSFHDINFCTINGCNGAGKSSLFMDAIIDCLYEEPREGELTGWIRADESARSGSIMFSFRIGDALFRVTRTRTKSGKATLNLSEYVENQWENRSKEKLKDTQAEIISVVGMDSLTFRSCALIMQDQYGLFLQADKEKRVQVLSNILGLGMYDQMEAQTREDLTDVNRKINGLKTQILVLEEAFIEEDILNEEQAQCQKELEMAEQSIVLAQTEKDVALQSLSVMENHRGRFDELTNEITEISSELNLYPEKKSALMSELSENTSKMKLIPIALAKIEEYQGLERVYKELLPQKGRFDSLVDQQEDKRTGMAELVSQRKIQEVRQKEYSAKVQALEEKLSDTSVKEGFDQWISVKERVAVLEDLQILFHEKQQEANEKKSTFQALESSYLSEYQGRCDQILQLKAKMELLQSCDCIDIEQAHCGFLLDAKKAAFQYNTVLPESKRWKQETLQQVDEVKQQYESAVVALDQLNFNAKELEELRCQIARLEPLAMEYKSRGALEAQVQSLREILEETTQSVRGFEPRLSKYADEIYALEKEVETLQSEVEYLNDVELKMGEAEKWLSFQTEIPILEQEQVVLEQKIETLKEAESKLFLAFNTSNAKQKELQRLLETEEDVRANHGACSEKLCELQAVKSDVQVKLGAIAQGLSVIQANKNDCRKLEQEIETMADKSAILELLKQAFSQDGVPHNIIKSLLPRITEIANHILGQMTGGKMGMDFKTEKVLKSNQKKEVVTLDILVEEYGKPALHYNSKSGGEKVKSALSAILALAEIKSSSDGIQLGMLFIDEPPFLDNDGTQAYCDALVTIGDRYGDVKIMAITHDPAMKARFPQNLDVVKTADGSKVVFS